MPKSAVASVSTKRPTENAPSITSPQITEQRLGEHDAAERIGKRTPLPMHFQERPPPQGEQQDERDRENERRADEEVDGRNREVTDDPDPVRQDLHGSTVISAICTLLLSSSASKRPGIVALNGSRTVPPAATFRAMS